MNFLSYLGGIPASAKEAVDVIAKGPAPTELELSLRQMHADHLTAMQAIKNLTEIAVNQTTRAVDQVAQLRELRRTITASEVKHLAAFELALRPVMRATDTLMEKVNNVEMELFANRSMIDVMRKELLADREAALVIHGAKLDLVAERLDKLVKVVARSLIKHPEGVTVAPPPKPRGGKRSNAGRKPGSKPRPLDVQYADVSNRLQRCRPNSKARLIYQFRLTELRQKLGMAPIRKEG